MAEETAQLVRPTLQSPGVVPFKGLRFRAIDIPGMPVYLEIARAEIRARTSPTATDAHAFCCGVIAILSLKPVNAKTGPG
jgi:hypothetical protein